MTLLKSGKDIARNKFIYLLALNGFYLFTIYIIK
jgi:hypothetical protein